MRIKYVLPIILMILFSVSTIAFLPVGSILDQELDKELDLGRESGLTFATVNSPNPGEIKAEVNLGYDPSWPCSDPANPCMVTLEVCMPGETYCQTWGRTSEIGREGFTTYTTCGAFEDKQRYFYQGKFEPSIQTSLLSSGLPPGDYPVSVEVYTGCSADGGQFVRVLEQTIVHVEAPIEPICTFDSDCLPSSWTNDYSWTNQNSCSNGDIWDWEVTYECIAGGSVLSSCRENSDFTIKTVCADACSTGDTSCPSCTPGTEWTYTEWGLCQSDNTQVRFGTDECGTRKSFTQSCTFTVQETCEDKIQNRGETGIDCGGPCESCTISTKKCYNNNCDFQETPTLDDCPTTHPLLTKPTDCTVITLPSDTCYTCAGTIGSTPRLVANPGTEITTKLEKCTDWKHYYPTDKLTCSQGVVVTNSAFFDPEIISLKIVDQTGGFVDPNDADMSQFTPGQKVNVLVNFKNKAVYDPTLAESMGITYNEIKTGAIESVSGISSKSVICSIAGHIESGVSLLVSSGFFDGWDWAENKCLTIFPDKVLTTEELTKVADDRRLAIEACDVDPMCNIAKVEIALYGMDAAKGITGYYSGVDFSRLGIGIENILSLTQTSSCQKVDGKYESEFGFITTYEVVLLPTDVDGSCKKLDENDPNDYGGACEYNVIVTIEIPTREDRISLTDAAGNYMSNFDPNGKYVVHAAIFDKCYEEDKDGKVLSAPGEGLLRVTDGTRGPGIYVIETNPNSGITLKVGDTYLSNDTKKWCIKAEPPEEDECFQRKVNYKFSEIGTMDSFEIESKKRDDHFLAWEDYPLCWNDYGDIQCKDGGECLNAINSPISSYTREKAVYDVLEKQIIGASWYEVWKGQWWIEFGLFEAGEEKKVESYGICVQEETPFFKDLIASINRAFGWPSTSPNGTMVLFGGVGLALFILSRLMSPKAPRRF